MLSIAVCDDEVIECYNMAKRIKEIMDKIRDALEDAEEEN